MSGEMLLRALIRESMDGFPVAEQEVVEYILKKLDENRDFINEIFGNNKSKKALIISCAIAIAKRESNLGVSNAYKYGVGRGSDIVAPLRSKFFQNAMTSAANLRNVGAPSTAALTLGTSLAGSVIDPSVGVTQIRMSNIRDSENEDMQKIVSKYGIESGWDLDDPFNAVISTAAFIESLYEKAISLGYSTTQPGVGGTRPDGTPRVWTSTGNAALDLAVTAYNKGESAISNYCGSEYIKKPCPPGSPDIVKNYIPFFGDQTRNTMFYVTAIAKSLPALIPKVMQHV